MQEIELKFQIPQAALAAVQAELARLNQGQNTDLLLRAAYFDTPDRKLAAARMALRVRQEGEEWVQTLKAGGSNTMMRLEDNQPAQPPRKGQAIQADLGRHLGQAAQAALQQVLGWSPEQDPSGRQAGLVELYGTDMVRTRAQVTVAAGTPYEGVVELALDLGRIHAGALSVPVRELEIEAISGHPMAVILAGRDWVARQGLWLDTQTKAHRGDRLAREAAQPAPAPQSHATNARPAKIKPDADMDQAWRTGLESCLEHISGNLSELGGAPSRTVEAAYELRLGLRRLRAFERLWRGSAWALPGSIADKAGVLSTQLGYWRDQQALAWLPGKLARMGWLDLPLPSPTPHAHQPADVVALARGHLATDLCLDLLAMLLQAEPHSASQTASNWIGQRLQRWAQRVARRGHGLSKQSDNDLHQLRKQAKRLRLAAALYAPLWPEKAGRRQERALKAMLDALGHIQDEVVAHHWYATQADAAPMSGPMSRAACDWLEGRRKGLRKKAQRAFERWLKVSSPW